MDSKARSLPPIIQPTHYQALQSQDSLLSGFWLFVGLLTVWALISAQDSSINSIMGTILMSFAALLPSYLWCSKKALGLPIFPLFALTYLWTYGLQPITNDSLNLNYSSDSQLFASVTVAAFLGIATFIWFQFVNYAPHPPKYYRAFSSEQAEPVFLLSLAAGILLTASNLAGWLNLDGGLFAIIRAITLAVNALAIFVMAYNWGSRKLAGNRVAWFLILLLFYFIINAVSLVLVASISASLLAIIAFIFGRSRIPWAMIIVSLTFFGLLHFGKAEMRNKYWLPNAVHHVQPWEYPSWYSEWVGYSVDYFKYPRDRKEEKEEPLKRSSLIHLLLLVQTKSPRDIPYLSGDSYAIIPQLLIPRFLNANKITSHEGTHLLSIHYGLQTRQDTERTTIGWGLLNESYANFGFLGSIGLACLLGYGYGIATKWSMNSPILSARFLFAIILISFALQTEFSAGVYVSALFQSALPLVAVTFTLMRVYTSE